MDKSANPPYGPQPTLADRTAEAVFAWQEAYRVVRTEMTLGPTVLEADDVRIKAADVALQLVLSR
jgi:hypothetical protein